VTYRPFTMNDLGGLNEDENTAALAPNQLREAINCARKGAMTGTRPGVSYDSQYTAAISGTPIIQGIHEFRAGRDATRRLVAVGGANVYYDSTNAALGKTSCTITSGTDYLWTFASYQNLMWAAGGLQGTDDIWTWNGNPASNVTGRLSALATRIRPKYVFSKFNCLFLGGMNGTTAYDNDLCARYPDYATDATDAANWPTSNTIPGAALGENPGVGSYGEEFNTGFGSYQDNRGDFLLFLTNKRIVSFAENPAVTANSNRFVETDAIANGCVDQRAFVDLGYDQGDAVYVSEDGIHSMALSQEYGTRQNTFLTWPIRKTWETLNRSRLKYTTAAYWPNEGLVLFAFSTGSSSTHNLIMAMDIKGARQISPDSVRWYKWYLNGITPNVLRAARDPNGLPTIYVGTTAGKVGAFGRTAYSDLGGAIPVNFRTKDEDFGIPAAEKSIGDTFLMVSGSGTYRPTHAYTLDDGSKTGVSSSINVTLTGWEIGTGSNGGIIGTTEIGGSENLSRERIRGVGSAFTISHQFIHGGNNQPFFIGQMTQDVAGQGIADEAA
jgi:hypothetical protein